MRPPPRTLSGSTTWVKIRKECGTVKYSVLDGSSKVLQAYLLIRNKENINHFWFMLFTDQAPGYKAFFHAQLSRA